MLQLGLDLSQSFKLLTLRLHDSTDARQNEVHVFHVKRLIQERVQVMIRSRCLARILAGALCNLHLINSDAKLLRYCSIIICYAFVQGQRLGRLLIIRQVDLGALFGLEEQLWRRI